MIHCYMPVISETERTGNRAVRISRRQMVRQRAQRSVSLCRTRMPHEEPRPRCTLPNRTTVHPQRARRSPHFSSWGEANVRTPSWEVKICIDHASRAHSNLFTNHGSTAPVCFFINPHSFRLDSVPVGRNLFPKHWALTFQVRV